jgi:1-deoxy-D-xylulose-5-phosphate synthase
MVVMAPKDENELQSMVKTALVYEDGPIAFRYPRGTGVGVKIAAEPQVLPIGESEIVREGDDVLVIAIGNRVYPALEAAQTLADIGISTAVVNARFVKPLDTATILPLAERIGKVITIEDGVIMGGFGSAVLEALAASRLANVQVTNLGIPDEFIEQGDVKHLHAFYQCDADAVVRAAQKMIA